MYVSDEFLLRRRGYMEILRKQDIENFLQELGEELAKKFKEPVKIMMIGGAYMLLLVHNREFTEDVDIFPLNVAVSSQPNKETKAFQAAARAIAKRHELKRDWINDVAATMLGGLGPDPELRLWEKFDQLHVYIPNLDYILAMKLFAGREKDDPDIDALVQALSITTRQQLQTIVDRYILLRWQLEYRTNATVDRIARRWNLA
jgi:hypothetical protein